MPSIPDPLPPALHPCPSAIRSERSRDPPATLPGAGNAPLSIFRDWLFLEVRGGGGWIRQELSEPREFVPEGAVVLEMAFGSGAIVPGAESNQALLPDSSTGTGCRCA